MPFITECELHKYVPYIIEDNDMPGEFETADENDNDERKAEAVRATLEDEIAPTIPASILRKHANATLVIDEAAATRLGDELKSRLERGE